MSSVKVAQKVVKRPVKTKENDQLGIGSFDISEYQNLTPRNTARGFSFGLSGLCLPVDFLYEISTVNEADIDEEVAKAWEEESEKRWQAYLRGEEETISLDEFLREVRAR